MLIGCALPTILALRALGLVDRNDPVTELIAKNIIEFGKEGGEPADIEQRAVKALRPGNGASRP